MKRTLMITSLLVCAVFAIALVIASLGPRSANAQSNSQAQEQQDPRLQDFSQQEQQEINRGHAIAPVPLNLQGKSYALVGLGSYIVNAQAGCSGCHTNPEFRDGHDPFLGQGARIPGEHYLAGGTSFGPFTSRNITPDVNGLPAGLTQNQFFEVMRKGTDFDYEPPHVPSDTKDLLQVMPWPYFRNMTDRDLRSIYEYLRAIPHAEPGP